MKEDTMLDKKSEIILLDGGLGQEINSRASQDSSTPWSVKVMYDEPDIVTSVHADFLTAGARTVSINNYTASPTRLERHGFLDKFTETHSLAISLVERAIVDTDIARSDISIAGCLMPLAASYVAEAAHDYSRSYDEYCQLIEAQITGVDKFFGRDHVQYNRSIARSVCITTIWIASSYRDDII